MSWNCIDGKWCGLEYVPQLVLSGPTIGARFTPTSLYPFLEALSIIPDGGTTRIGSAYDIYPDFRVSGGRLYYSGGVFGDADLITTIIGGYLIKSKYEKL